MAFLMRGILCRPSITRYAVQQNALMSTGTNASGDEEKPKGWISRFFSGSQYNPDGVDKQSHSSMLADSEVIFEIQTHDVRNGERESYLDKYQKFAKEINSATPGCELIGSWNVIYGNPDQTVHLWRYDNGYADVDRHIKALVDNSSVKAAEKDIAAMCGRRRTVLVKAFSYWGEPKPRQPSHIYDLRSYVLKPGSMIEWGNAWAKGINYRKEHNQNVAGFFAQVGQLYMVFHIWAYPSMTSRQHTRQTTWLKPGWDSTVAYTVPLIKKMQSKILVPNDFSYLK